MLAVAFVVAVTSSSVAAERPQPPETFAPVVDTARPAVLSVVHAHAPDPDALEADDLLGRLFDALSRLPNQTLGAAVMIDPSGIAVTGANLLRGMTEVAVVDVHGRRFRATLMSRDERTDIALLRVMGGGPFPVVGFGDSDTVRIGDWVVAVGSPYGFEASVSAGIVSARPRIGAGGPWGDVFQTDAAVNPGSAGGPLLNARGEMIGLAVVPAPRGSGIAFAAASNVVRKVVSDLLVHGHVVRSWLGVESQPLTPELARAFRAPFAGGLVLTEIVPGGPAARAGLTRGSIVLAFEGRPVRTTADLDAALSRLAPGTHGDARGLAGRAAGDRAGDAGTRAGLDESCSADTAGSGWCSKESRRRRESSWPRWRRGAPPSRPESSAATSCASSIDGSSAASRTSRRRRSRCPPGAPSRCSCNAAGRPCISR